MTFFFFLMIGAAQNTESKNILPHDHVVLRHVFSLADLRLTRHFGGVERRGDLDHDAVGAELGVEVGLHVDGELDARLADLLDDRMHAERQLHIRR